MSTLSIVAMIYVNDCIHMGFIAFWNLLINFCSVLFCSASVHLCLSPARKTGENQNCTVHQKKILGNPLLCIKGQS